MGLETVTWIDDLVTTNPVGSDPKSQGDNHLRNLKTGLTNTFPNADKAFRFPTAEAISANETIVAADENKLFVVTTTSGAITCTLPDTSTLSDGWQCHFVKVTTDVNPILIAPNSGTLISGSISGLSATRRAIPGAICTAFWTGNEWFVTRAPGNEVGCIIPFDGSSLPVGYEWPNGQTLSSASTNYPDYNSRKGSGATRDLRQRVIAGHNLGGSEASRLNGASGGVDGSTLGNTGGADTHTLVTGEMPTHSHAGSSLSMGSSGTHNHQLRNMSTSSIQKGSSSSFSYATGGNNYGGLIGTATSSDGDHTHSMSGSTGNSGSGNAHNNVQPTIVLGFILVVE